MVARPIVSSRAARPTRGVVLTENVGKVAGQQGRYAVRHDRHCGTKLPIRQDALTPHCLVHGALTGGPAGADNADQWKLISESFGW